MIWKQKKAQTGMIFIGIVAFWVVLSLLLTSYQNSGAPPLRGQSIGINSSADQDNFSDMSSSAGTGLMAVWNFTKMFFKLTTYYFPLFDSVSVTIFTGAILLIIKIATFWVLVRLVRGVG